MTEEQLRAFPVFRQLPIVDENSEQAVAITRDQARECITLDDVQKCLQNPKLVPIGALRAKPDGQPIVVAYFLNRGQNSD